MKPQLSKDCEKYGMKVGDVWTIKGTGGKRLTVGEYCGSNAFRCTQGYRIPYDDLGTLLYRAGVVDKL